MLSRDFGWEKCPQYDLCCVELDVFSVFQYNRNKHWIASIKQATPLYRGCGKVNKKCARFLDQFTNTNRRAICNSLPLDVRLTSCSAD